MSSINSHYYLVGHAANGENPEVVYMKPTAENIANFIMKHRDAEVTITDELDIPFVTASAFYDMTTGKERRMARYDY